jgi:hypothetical protein
MQIERGKIESVLSLRFAREIVWPLQSWSDFSLPKNESTVTLREGYYQTAKRGITFSILIPF